MGVSLLPVAEKRRRKKRRRKKQQHQQQMMEHQLKREPRKRRRRRRPPSKLAKPTNIFYFSNLLNSNLYVTCLLCFIWFLNNSNFGTNNFYQKHYLLFFNQKCNIIDTQL